MELETVNKLYLELSQVATAKTRRELELEAAEKERDALLAKIAEMEKQEPVAFALYSGWARKAVYLSEIEACEQRDRRQLTADLGGSLEAYRVAPLYLAPSHSPHRAFPKAGSRFLKSTRLLILSI